MTSTPALVPTHRHEPVHLSVSRHTSHSGGASRLIVTITDSTGHGPFPTTCRLPRHSRAIAPKKVRDVTGLWNLDCACDVACPKCGADEGRSCVTPGGYGAKDHPQRIAVSPRCRALIDGTRTYCDLGEHNWKPAGTDDPDAATEASCTRCERTEPVHPNPLPYSARH